jgi:hypothetical protein
MLLERDKIYIIKLETVTLEVSSQDSREVQAQNDHIHSCIAMIVMHLVTPI